ncbi:MAG: class I adenylate cyclase [Deltaproteobacteria bacterium]|nr:class I adenylate cyclase [Deltaproteobacteria bacterium]
MPVFFFVTDVDDVKKGNFGPLDAESSGSAQKNVLKEEFYRTCIVICGKIPLWWVVFDPHTLIDYDAALSAIQNPLYGLYDFIDLGNLQKVARNEYFGAALWQLHKSLSRSLKSIIKMTLLKMQLDLPDQPLICHRLREEVLSKKNSDVFPDPMCFTMLSILDNYRRARQDEWIEFLKKCFYLRCELKPYDKRHLRKKQLAAELFKHYPIDIKERIRLGRFDSWNFDSQIELGNQLFRFLVKIYREICAEHAGIGSDIDKQDLKVLGRKILVSYQYKPTKISVLQKPAGKLNISDMIIHMDGERWSIFSNPEKSRLVISSKDIVYNIAFMVWNDLFNVNRIHMEPNSSSVTLKEIINLGNKMKRFFGKSNVSEIEFSYFLKKPTITKLLIVVSFEKSPWEKDVNDFAFVYKNTWGELFVKRFDTQQKLKSFIKTIGRDADRAETSFYVQRNSASYEKIIARTRKILSMLTET